MILHESMAESAIGTWRVAGIEVAAVCSGETMLALHVVGLEGGIDYLGLVSSLSTEDVTNPDPRSGSTYELKTRYKTDYVATIGPRLGYAFCRFLPYVTGGLAVADVEFSQTLHQGGNGLGFFDENGNTTDTQVGWTVGGGLQYAITDHWSARAEYRYTDLGCVDFASAGVGGGNSPAFTGHHEACLTLHSVTFGLAYKF